MRDSCVGFAQLTCTVRGLLRTHSSRFSFDPAPVLGGVMAGSDGGILGRDHGEFHTEQEGLVLSLQH